METSGGDARQGAGDGPNGAPGGGGGGRGATRLCTRCTVTNSHTCPPSLPKRKGPCIK